MITGLTNLRKKPVSADASAFGLDDARLWYTSVHEHHQTAGLWAGAARGRNRGNVYANYTYLFWLFCFIGIPILVLLRWRQQLWQQRQALAWTVIGSLVGGWLWDALAVRVGLWHYDPARIAGIWFWGLPLEEWLWIVGVTLLFGGITILLAERMGVQHE